MASHAPDSRDRGLRRRNSSRLRATAFLSASSSGPGGALRPPAPVFAACRLLPPACSNPRLTSIMITLAFPRRCLLHRIRACRLRLATTVTNRQAQHFRRPDQSVDSLVAVLLIFCSSAYRHRLPVVGSYLIWRPIVPNSRLPAWSFGPAPPLRTHAGDRVFPAPTA